MNTGDTVDGSYRFLIHSHNEYDNIDDSDTHAMNNLRVTLGIRTEHEDTGLPDTKEIDPNNYSRDARYTDIVTISNMLDVKTAYNIFKKRARCVELFPNFARNATMKYFRDNLTILQDNTTSNIFFHDLYVAFNAQVLGIRIPREFIGELDFEVVLQTTLEDYLQEEAKTLRLVEEFTIETADMRVGLVDSILAHIQAMI